MGSLVSMTESKGVASPLIHFVTVSVSLEAFCRKSDNFLIMLHIHYMSWAFKNPLQGNCN